MSSRAHERARPSALLPPALLLVLVGAACRGDTPPPSDPSLRMEVGISPTPALVGSGRILVSLGDSGGRAVEDAVVEVTGVMGHPGMVPVVDTAERQAPGRWAVPDFAFEMAGEWVLEVRARLPDGRAAAVDQPILVVGGDR